MSSPLDKAARAAYEADRKKWHPAECGPGPWEIQSVGTKEHWREVVSAALATGGEQQADEEERRAWDLYACGDATLRGPKAAAEYADALLRHRRERFGTAGR